MRFDPNNHFFLDFEALIFNAVKKFIEFICFFIESYFIFVVLNLDSVFSPIEANSKLFVKLNSKQDEFLYEFVYFACWWR